MAIAMGLMSRKPMDEMELQPNTRVSISTRATLTADQHLGNGKFEKPDFVKERDISDNPP